MMDDQFQAMMHQKLVDILPEGTPIYFRPPTKMMLTYPCVVYDVKKHNALFADNTTYATGMTFTIRHLSVTPGNNDSLLLRYLKFSNYITSYTSNDIVHVVYEVHINSVS